MKTKRRDDLPFPNVWRRFSRTSGSGNTLKFKIQDCPEEMYDDLLDFMRQYFMRDETWNKALGIGDEELAIEEFSTFQSRVLPERLALICLADDEPQDNVKTNKPQILGFNLMNVTSKFDETPPTNAKSKAISKLLELFKETDITDTIYERYNITEFLGDCGLSVHPDFRGLGLSKELLLSRIDVAKSIGLKIIEATFTSSVSQGSAEKCGYETFLEIPYHEFEKKVKVDFKTESKCIKIMVYVNK